MKSNRTKKSYKPVLLVVDDTEDNLDLLEFALKQKPVKLLRAKSGIECLRIAKDKTPDIILLDIQMPEMDGFETLQKLRDNPITSSIPVIMLTAHYKDPESIEKGFKLGADEYITKPVEIEELVVRIRMLIRMKHMKDELDQTKLDYMAMLIHDLRGPLVGITSVVELLKDLKPGAALRQEHFEMFRSADISLQQMLTLINNFLDLSKYNSDAICLHQEPVPLHMLVEQALQKLEFQFKQKQIELEHRVGRDLPEAYIDAQKTLQVFINLLDNAFKFTERGGAVSISAELRNGTNGRQKNESYIGVSVTDTGMGIDTGEINKLFSPYQQTASAQSISEKGTGLGLSICKLIVEAQGGSISVSSDPGKQTTFYFTLPVAKQN